MTNLTGSNLNRREATGPKGEGRDSPSTFPKYPEYKDSGVEWLGEVPAHWSVAPISSQFRLRNGYPFKAELFTPEGAPSDRLIRIRDILKDESRIFTSELCPSWAKVKDGDVLIGMDGDFNVTYWDKGLAKLNQRVCALRGESLAWDKFLFYGITQPLNVINDLTFSTTVKHLSSDQVLKMRFPSPPESETSNIVAFLDHETARIDALVEEQQRLIELLKEKRQAVISHAVTKGLNPDVTMRDSGVEWLGEVPAHWEVIKLGLVTSDKCDGPFGSALKSEHYTECGVRVIRLQNIKSGNFNNSDAAYIDDVYYESAIAKSDVAPGDVLVAGLGDERNIVGRACVAPDGIGPAMVKADCFRFRLIPEKAFPDFIAEQLSSGAEADAGVMSSGSTRSRIPLSVMSTRKVALPPLKEQHEIYQYVSVLKNKFDLLSKEAKLAIRLLLERRSALIFAAVTGKIDVRGWQADQQPEQSEMLMVAEAQATYG